MDKKDLIYEEWEDLLRSLRYDPLLCSRSLTPGSLRDADDKENRNERFASRYGLQ